MRWPWTREKRESQPYTDAIVAALQEQAGGTLAGSPSALGALEIAAGYWARAFASAEIQPANEVTAAITPAYLALIGRELCRRGECVFSIDVDAAGVRLFPAGSWDIRGGYDERSWWYRIDLFGASQNVTKFVPGQAVIHPRYAVDPGNPWLGLSPLQYARTAGALASNLEKRLGEEAGGSVGHILPIPHDGGDGTDSDPLAALKGDLRAGKGRTLLMETTAAGWDEGKASAPQVDWKPRRFGADPPDALVNLKSEAALTVLSACGVPPMLAASKAGDTGQREAWRRFLHGTVQPVAVLVAEELSAKLDQEIRISFDALFASDLAGRARAFASLVKAGMPLEKAAGLAGLLESDDE